jgi:hypothetical protein
MKQLMEIINWLKKTKPLMDSIMSETHAEHIDLTLWFKIEPQFTAHCNIEIQTVDNISDFSKLKHK